MSVIKFVRSRPAALTTCFSGFTEPIRNQLNSCHVGLSQVNSNFPLRQKKKKKEMAIEKKFAFETTITALAELHRLTNRV